MVRRGERMMRRLATTLAVCVALGVPLLPAAALAGGKAHFQRSHHTRGGSPAHGNFQAIPEFRPKGAFGSPGGFPLAIQPSHHGRSARMFPSHLTRRFSHRAFAPGFLSTAFPYAPLYGPSVDAAPPVVTVSPVIYNATTVYVSPPAASSQPVAVSAPPPAESAWPTVIEHPTGRYELRGDGVAIPVWVWIPYPPPVPPAAASSPAEEPPVGTAPLARRTATYQWTDEEGTTFVTNRLETVPRAYRSRVRGPAPAAR